MNISIIDKKILPLCFQGHFWSYTLLVSPVGINLWLIEMNPRIGKISYISWPSELQKFIVFRLYPGRKENCNVKNHPLRSFLTSPTLNVTLVESKYSASGITYLRDTPVISLNCGVVICAWASRNFTNFFLRVFMASA